MLKSIVYLLVLISFITTPTRAYEAYEMSNFIAFQQKQAFKAQNLYKPAEMAGKELGNQAKAVPETHQLCVLAARKAENDFGIKENLLETIASVESGRFLTSLNKRVSWPWTVHANGKGYYFKTKAEAVNAVKAMQSRGIRNIDVGCMQINLKYHGQAFESLEDAFDPEKNVRYSASFLLKLLKSNKQDWKKTAMHYHSKNLRKGINYKNRLEKHFAQYVRVDSGQTLF